MNNFLDKTSRATVSLARMALSLAIIAWAAIGIQDSMSHLFGHKKKVVVYVEKTTKTKDPEVIPTDKEEENKPSPKKSTGKKVVEPKVEGDTPTPEIKESK